MKERIYITFSGSRYHRPTERIVQDAPKFGAARVLVYDDHWLSTCRSDFKQQASDLFNHPKMRGYGWFCWKPFVIIDALKRHPDAVILFTDGDTYPIRDLSIIYEIAERDGLMLFTAEACWQRRWCKRDCFIIMDQDKPEYYDRQHAVARFMAFTSTHLPFLEEWQRYVLDIRCNTFDPSTLGPELEGFHEHRCEQAILTNLAHKYGHRLYREACQFGEGSALDRDLYEQLFVQIGDYSQSGKPHSGSFFRNVFD